MSQSFLDDKQYGRPINFENNSQNGVSTMGANSMVSQFLNVKSNYRENLDELTEGDSHACRFFCADDCAHVFSINIMKAIINAIENKAREKEIDPDGCVVLFHGVRKDELKKQVDGQKGFAFGRPTLIAAAYLIDGKNLEHVDVTYSLKDSSGTAEAFEHPGNGTGGTTKPSPLTVSTEKVIAHVVKRNQNPDCDTDFSISKSIPLASITKWL